MTSHRIGHSGLERFRLGGAPALCFATLLSLVLAACRDAPQETRNVLLVTVDTLRADHLGSYGYPIATSPAVDALAARGVRFETCIAQASFTVPSLASMMTGRSASEYGVTGNGTPLPRDATTLAGVLRRAGFQTAAVVSNYALRPRMQFNFGFGHYDAEFTDSERNRPDIKTRNAEHTTDAVIAWLREGRDKTGPPFFLWAHYHDPHGPYAPPPEHLPALENYPKQELPALSQNFAKDGIPKYQVVDDLRESAHYRARYDGEIRYFDQHFGRLMAHLDETGLGATTAVIFSADHGESMGEHRYWFSHGQDLFDELLRVPLIIAAPGLEPATVIAPAALTDLFPTILAMLGVVPEEGVQLRGQNLLAADFTGRPRAIYSELNNVTSNDFLRSIRHGRWKLIASQTPSTLPELYDLESDPGEQKSLHPQSLPKGSASPELVEVASTLGKLLVEEEKRAIWWKDVDELSLSEEERAVLKALGYLEEDE